jgi:hypothetical protein
MLSLLLEGCFFIFIYGPYYLYAYTDFVKMTYNIKSSRRQNTLSLLSYSIEYTIFRYTPNLHKKFHILKHN